MREMEYVSQENSWWYVVLSCFPALREHHRVVEECSSICINERLQLIVWDLHDGCFFPDGLSDCPKNRCNYCQRFELSVFQSNQRLWVSKSEEVKGLFESLTVLYQSLAFSKNFKCGLLLFFFSVTN